MAKSISKTIGSKLVIVESPTKANTIGKFLGPGYRVDSSFGHVRDLPKSELGIDLDHDFEPRYVIPTKSRKQVNRLKKEAAAAAEIILATDEDREGEAIAFHLVHALGLEAKLNSDQVKRIVFHEITPEAINHALAHPRRLDFNLVNAQQARRLLDRLVGYKLSPLLWKKVMRGLSAGRVQSVAVRLIVEREQAIRDFKPEEYFTVNADFAVGPDSKALSAVLVKIGGRSLPKPGLKAKDEVDRIVTDLKQSACSVVSVKQRQIKKNPSPPFITSTLQRTAASRLGFSAKKTMIIAQRLYENGHITYMRTDSVNLAASALAAAKTFLVSQFGFAYTAAAPRRFSQKSKLAQEAHEAIRPTNPHLLADSLEADRDTRRLYELIWQRFLASQMPAAVFAGTTVEIEAKGGRRYLLRAAGNVLKFDGFLKVWPSKFKEEQLPDVKEGESAAPVKVVASRHETEPPPRFNEASLIKALEENGIGRPSTYASIISVIQTRNYVAKNDQKRFIPTEIGEIVNKLLVEHFPKIVDVGFTADVEEELDEIALGVSNWREVIRKFYEPFSKRLAEKYEVLNKDDILPEETTSEKCEKCGRPMIIKHGRFGKFLACSGFPDCKNTKKIPGAAGGFKSESTGVKCPECGMGELVSRRVSRGRARGKIFWGCSRYPDCKHAVWEKPAA